MISLDDKREIFQHQQAMLEDLQKILPQNKPTMVLEFEIDCTHWDFLQIEEYIKKLCEEHEGKRALHIKFVGKANPIDESIT